MYAIVNAGRQFKQLLHARFRVFVATRRDPGGTLFQFLQQRSTPLQFRTLCLEHLLGIRHVSVEERLSVRAEWGFGCCQHGTTESQYSHPMHPGNKTTMRWRTVVSQPEILTQYAWSLGMRRDCALEDLLVLDPELAVELGLAVDHCQALVLLFPLSDRDREAAPLSDTDATYPSVCFVRQTVENSCALMALLHILLNRRKLLADQTVLTAVFGEGLPADNTTPIEGARRIEASPMLASLHASFASHGDGQQDEQQQQEEEEEDDVPFHYVAFVPTESMLWVLDGRRAHPMAFPLKDCESSFATMCRVIQEEYVSVVPEEDRLNFSALVLVDTDK